MEQAASSVQRVSLTALDCVVELPVGSRVLTVAGRDEALWLYYLATPLPVTRLEPRRFVVVSTGVARVSHSMQYIGSYKVEGGGEKGGLFHVFEAPFVVHDE